MPDFNVLKAKNGKRAKGEGERNVHYLQGFHPFGAFQGRSRGQPIQQHESVGRRLRIEGNRFGTHKPVGVKQKVFTQDTLAKRSTWS